MCGRHLDLRFYILPAPRPTGVLRQRGPVWACAPPVDSYRGRVTVTTFTSQLPPRAGVTGRVAIRLVDSFTRPPLPTPGSARIEGL